MQNPKTIQTFCNEQLNIILTDISRGKKHATRIHGASGIGKTAIIKQLVVNLTAHTGNEWGFETINCANHSAVDLTGVPTIVNGKTVFARLNFYLISAHRTRLNLAFSLSMKSTRPRAI